MEDRRLLDSIHRIAVASDEATCLQRISEEAERLFGAYRPEVVIQARLDRGARVALSAAGELVGEIIIDSGVPVDPDSAAALKTFAAHAGLALRNARLLDTYEQRTRLDALTGLRNYGEFRSTLPGLLGWTGGRAGGGGFGLVVMDLDHFREVNERHGHGAGDRLLRSTAAALSAICRAEDSAFRIGGDDFALLLRGADRVQTLRVAERAMQAVDRLGGSAGLSCGVAAAPFDGHTGDELMAVAGRALRAHQRPEAVSDA